MTARSLRLLAAVLLTLALIPAFATQATASPPAAARSHRLQVVQLGDSYSAGNGAGSYTDTTCYRSLDSYGAQFSRSMQATYINRACSGAVTKDLTNATDKGAAVQHTATYQLTATTEDAARRQWLRKARAADLCGTPPVRDSHYADDLGTLAQAGPDWTGTLTCQLVVARQVAAITPRTDVVLLTIGGNDIGFSNIVGACMALRSPTACKPVMDNANALLPANQASVKHVFDVIARRSDGHAKVYLLPYPNLLNTEHYTIPEGVPGGYDFGAALAALQARGDLLQKQAVAQYNRAGGDGRYYWVGRVIPAWSGHGLDPHIVPDNSQAWLVPLFSPGRASAEYVHPTLRGWSATAIALTGYYANHH